MTMLFAITIGDKTTVIDAPSKAAANAYAYSNVKVDVRIATKADLTGLDLSSIPSVLKGGKTQAEVDAEAATAADKKAKKEAKAKAEAAPV